MLYISKVLYNISKLLITINDRNQIKKLAVQLMTCQPTRPKMSFVMMFAMHWWKVVFLSKSFEPAFKHFLDSYTQFKTPCETMVRSVYLQHKAKECIEKIRRAFQSVYLGVEWRDNRLKRPIRCACARWVPVKWNKFSFFSFIV